MPLQAAQNVQLDFIKTIWSLFVINAIFHVLNAMVQQ